MLYFTHLALSKCAQIATAGLGDTLLSDIIVSYYECSFIFLWQHFKGGKIITRLAVFPGSFSVKNQFMLAYCGLNDLKVHIYRCISDLYVVMLAFTF